jgi:hypothetical protein
VADTARALRAEIDAEHAAYAARPLDAGALLRAKVRSVHWRARMRTRLLDAAEADPAIRAGLVDDLLALGGRLAGDDLARVGALVDEAALGRLLAEQGERHPATPEHHALAGPDLDLKIEVNRDSPWPFERWRQERAFAEYAFEDGGVRYRGLLLRPGDLILPNVNLDGNFVYSALSDPKGFCPHSAVFVLLEAEGALWPAVIETYEKGLRAVPLCVFLNARYVSYAEIWRHPDMTDDLGRRIPAEAAEQMALARGYNFDTTDDDERYVCCTNVALQLYRRLGLRVLEDVGAIVDPGIRETMTRLDYVHLDRFFTPVDFLTSGLFEYVGCVDNGQPARLLARELVEARFRHGFSAGDLDWRRVPIAARINHFGIRQMRRRTLLGRLVSAVMGFDHVTLPKGPDRILAIVEPLEAQLGRAVQGVLPEVERRLADTETVDLDAWLADPDLRTRVEALLPLRWLGL